MELKRINKKYSDAEYPKRFIDSVVREYTENTEDVDIPNWLFEDRQTVTFRLPYCDLNEKQSSQFTDKLSKFTQNKYIFRVIWQTRKIRSLFPLKDRNVHKSCVIYKGLCSCGETYIGETDRNALIRWGEHNTPSVNSEPAKPILDHTDTQI